MRATPLLTWISAHLEDSRKFCHFRTLQESFFFINRCIWIMVLEERCDVILVLSVIAPKREMRRRRKRDSHLISATLLPALWKISRGTNCLPYPNGNLWKHLRDVNEKGNWRRLWTLLRIVREELEMGVQHLLLVFSGISEALFCIGS